MQKNLGFLEAVPVARVNYKDHSVDLVEVVFPEARGLPTHIPQGEQYILILDLFHVQAHCRHCVLELVISHLEQ